ncbi:MAG TPA: hypothetical protein VHQ47_17720 [Phycisphaerae bacterium]|nr:hypothetical protein [Phycisphaerae bacterium]
MNDDDIVKRNKIRRLRGSLLRTARTAYGDDAGVAIENLHHVAGRSRWTEAQILAEVQYLIDMGMLERREFRRDKLDREPLCDFRLTARGIQLLNGDIEEPSIEL